MGGIQKTQVPWQAVFLAALPLTISGSAAKPLFRASTIPPATQANTGEDTRATEIDPLKQASPHLLS